MKIIIAHLSLGIKSDYIKLLKGQKQVKGKKEHQSKIIDHLLYVSISSLISFPFLIILQCHV